MLTVTAEKRKYLLKLCNVTTVKYNCFTIKTFQISCKWTKISTEYLGKPVKKDTVSET